MAKNVSTLKELAPDLLEKLYNYGEVEGLTRVQVAAIINSLTFKSDPIFDLCGLENEVEILLLCLTITHDVSVIRTIFVGSDGDLDIAYFVALVSEAGGDSSEALDIAKQHPSRDELIQSDARALPMKDQYRRQLYQKLRRDGFSEVQAMEEAALAFLLSPDSHAIPRDLYYELVKAGSSSPRYHFTEWDRIRCANFDVESWPLTCQELAKFLVDNY